MSDWKQVSDDRWEKVVVRESTSKFGNKKTKVSVSIHKDQTEYEVYITPQSKYIRSYSFPSLNRAVSFATYYMDRYPNAEQHPSQEEYSKF